MVDRLAPLALPFLAPKAPSRQCAFPLSRLRRAGHLIRAVARNMASNAISGAPGASVRCMKGTLPILGIAPPAPSEQAVIPKPTNLRKFSGVDFQRRQSAAASRPKSISAVRSLRSLSVLSQSRPAWRPAAHFATAGLRPGLANLALTCFVPICARPSALQSVEILLIQRRPEPCPCRAVPPHRIGPPSVPAFATS